MLIDLICFRFGEMSKIMVPRETALLMTQLQSIGPSRKARGAAKPAVPALESLLSCTSRQGHILSALPSSNITTPNFLEMYVSPDLHMMHHSHTE